LDRSYDPVGILGTVRVGVKKAEKQGFNVSRFQGFRVSEFQGDLFEEYCPCNVETLHFLLFSSVAVLETLKL
jgi:hypothetical protein